MENSISDHKEYQNISFRWLENHEIKFEIIWKPWN